MNDKKESKVKTFLQNKPVKTLLDSLLSKPFLSLGTILVIIGIVFLILIF